MSKRFSKAALVGDLRERYLALQKRHGFDPRIGWVQVQRSEIDRVIAYGAFDIIEQLLEEYEH